MPLMNHDTIPDHPDRAVTDDLAILNIAACHSAHAGDLVGLTNLRMAQHHLSVLGASMPFMADSISSIQS